MQLSKTSLNFSNHYHPVDVPLYCPYCGKAVEFKETGSTDIFFKNNHYFYLKILYSKCCEKYSSALYLLKRQNQSSDEISLISFYPNSRGKYFSKYIQDLSPDCIRLYNDSSFAFDNNMNDLAGMGYRKSLEYLVKDYAITELKKPEQEVSKKKLYNAIEEYLPNNMLINAADVVRILGNDKTHFQEKFQEYDVQVIKEYLDILIDQITILLKLSHPPVSRQN